MDSEGSNSKCPRAKSAMSIPSSTGREQERRNASRVRRSPVSASHPCSPREEAAWRSRAWVEFGKRFGGAFSFSPIANPESEGDGDIADIESGACFDAACGRPSVSPACTSPCDEVMNLASGRRRRRRLSKECSQWTQGFLNVLGVMSLSVILTLSAAVLVLPPHEREAMAVRAASLVNLNGTVNDSETQVGVVGVAPDPEVVRVGAGSGNIGARRRVSGRWFSGVSGAGRPPHARTREEIDADMVTIPMATQLSGARRPSAIASRMVSYLTDDFDVRVSTRAAVAEQAGRVDATKYEGDTAVQYVQQDQDVDVGAPRDS